MEKPNARTQSSAPFYPASMPATPVVSQAPVNHPIASNKGNLLMVAGIAGALLFAAALIIGFGYLLHSNAKNYEKKYASDPIKIEHEVLGEGKNKPVPPLSSWVSPALKKELMEGQGQKFLIIPLYNGEGTIGDEVDIDPWASWEETTPAFRQKYVDGKLSELDQKLKDLAVYKPRDWNVVLMLDDTEGINDKLKAMYLSNYENLQIDERAKLGDGISLHFAKLSFTDYIEERTVVIPKGSNGIPGGAAKDISAANEWLTSSRQQKGSSSVFLGIMNVLKSYRQQPATQVVIISDMMENDPQGTGVTFYDDKSNPQLLAESNWPALDQKLLAAMHITLPTDNNTPPPLKGMSITIHAPPTVKGHTKIPKMAQAYASHFFTALGASVQTVFKEELAR